MKLLKVALERRRYELAAHILVFGLVKAKIEALGNNDGQKRRFQEGAKRGRNSG